MSVPCPSVNQRRWYDGGAFCAVTVERRRAVVIGGMPSRRRRLRVAYVPIEKCARDASAINGDNTEAELLAARNGNGDMKRNKIELAEIVLVAAS